MSRSTLAHRIWLAQEQVWEHLAETYPNCPFDRILEEGRARRKRITAPLAARRVSHGIASNA